MYIRLTTNEYRTELQITLSVHTPKSRSLNFFLWFVLFNFTTSFVFMQFTGPFLTFHHNPAWEVELEAAKACSSPELL